MLFRTLALSKCLCRDCTSILKHEDRPSLQLLAIKREQKYTAAKQDRMNKTAEQWILQNYHEFRTDREKTTKT